MLLTPTEARRMSCPFDPNPELGVGCTATACPLWRWTDAPARVQTVALGYCGAHGSRPPTRLRDGRLPTAEQLSGAVQAFDL